MEERDIIRLTDPRALRAYAHPVRLKLVGLLRSHGPLTATKAGELLGESSGTCSFHLRQLAKYGLVEEAGGGAGRQKPWRATTRFTYVPEVPDTPEAAEAADRVRAALAKEYFDKVTDWLRRRPYEPQDWQQASVFGDKFLYLTPGELDELRRQVSALLAPYEDRQAGTPSTRQVTWVQLAFPS